MIIKSNNEQPDFYFDRRLLNYLAEWKHAVMKEDFDCPIIMGGEEGTGKSSLGMQIGSVWAGERFSVKKNVRWRAKDLMNAAVDSETKRGDVFILDEGYRSLAGINRGKEEVEELLAFMTEVRKRNLCFILLIPRIYQMVETIIFERAKMWINLELRKKKGRKINTKRGRARVYSKENVGYIMKKDYKATKHYPKHVGFPISFGKTCGMIDKKEYDKAVNKFLEDRYKEKKEAEITISKIDENKPHCDSCMSTQIYVTKIGKKCRRCGNIMPITHTQKTR